MTGVGLLHDEIRRGLNKINNTYKKTIPVIDVDGYINKSISFIQENYSSILERNKVVASRLRELELPYIKLDPKENTELYKSYKLPSDHYMTLAVYPFASKDKCTKSSIKASNIKHYQIRECLDNPNCKPSFNWRETIYNETKYDINIFHNNNFDIVELYIDYLIKIPNVYYASGAKGPYVLSDNTTIVEDHNLIIDDPVLINKICEVALHFIKRDLDENYQTTMESILFTNKIFT